MARAIPLATLAAALVTVPVLTTAHAEPLSERLVSPAHADVAITSHVVKPRPLSPPRDAGHIRAPDGFEVEVFACDLGNTRMIAVRDNGDVYVTRRREGDVILLRDADGDGRADLTRVLARRPGLHGIALGEDTLYLSAVREVWRAPIESDGRLGRLERIIDDLPDGGQHPNRTLTLGPDGMLYISVGSTCNACGETNPENATLLRASPDGRQRTIFASGLRNTIGFAFEPASGSLYGMDHGIDWLGDTLQPEELNLILEGGIYGWPYIFGDQQANPADQPDGVSLAQWRDLSIRPVGLYTAHAAPMQMAFSTGEAFRESYRGDAFVAMRGSWNRRPPSGYEVVRIRFEDGRPLGFEPFLTGFLTRDENGDWGRHARLSGIAMTPDGALLVSDDANGIIYRVGWAGGRTQAEARQSPDGLTLTNADGAPVGVLPVSAQARLKRDHAPPPAGERALVIDRLGADASPLAVSSDAFEEGAAIPESHGADGENISPPLRWDAGPAGTQSYVVLIEDPDAGAKPFAHWVLYNLPAAVTRLPEAVPTGLRAPGLGGAMQGRNDRGSTGYYGPRPPSDDPAHAYHVQVFALDRTLSLQPAPTLAEVARAIEGHVLAAGEHVGTFER